MLLVCTPLVAGSHHGCTVVEVSYWSQTGGTQVHSWRGLVPSTCMAVGFNWGYLGWHLALTQPRSPGLVAGVGADLRLQRRKEGREQGGGQCLQIQVTCGATTDEICRASAAAVLAFGFLSDESCWGPPTKGGSRGCSHCWADTGSPSSPSLFPATSQVSAPPVSPSALMYV